MNVSMYYRSGNHGVLLAKDINYSQLLEHVKQRFRIEDDYVTRLSFFLGRKEFRVGDDDAVEYFAHHVINRKAGKLIITTIKKSYEVSSSSSKPLDFDHTDSVVSSGSDENVSFVHSKSEEDCVNPGFNYAWQLTNTFKHTPTLPSTPLLVIKPLKGKLSDRECMRPSVLKLDANSKYYHLSFQVLINLLSQAWLGRDKASKIAMGCPMKSFHQLPFYCYNLKMKNKGTVTDILSDDNGRFKMLYVGFGVAIWSFLNSMRLLIIIDVIHLKGEYLGTNLVVIGMDGNNQIIPIATGVCQVPSLGLSFGRPAKHTQSWNLGTLPWKSIQLHDIKLSRMHSFVNKGCSESANNDEKVKRKQTSQLSTSQPQTGIRSPKGLVTSEDQEKVKRKRTSTSQPQR
nr:transposase, MuDR, MULE transposase domain protein [Tanacetum cinerariifolium]